MSKPNGHDSKHIVEAFRKIAYKENGHAMAMTRPEMEAFLIEWHGKPYIEGFEHGTTAGKKQMIDEVEKWNFEYDGRENWIYNLIVHLKSL